MSVYIPWSSEAQLSEPSTGRTYIGPLRDCVWAYLELNPQVRINALIIADVNVPLAGGRDTKILEAEEIEWLIDRLGSDVYRPAEVRGHWLTGMPA